MTTDAKQRTPCSLAARLGALLGLGTVLVLAAVFGLNHAHLRGVLARELDARVRDLARAARSEIVAVILNVEKGPRLVAAMLESEPVLDEPGILARCRHLVATEPDSFGSTIAFEPYRFDPQRLYYAPYYCRGAEGLALSWLGSDQYPYFELPWYRIPREREEPVWTEPYFDEGGGDIIMSTFSVPFHRPTPAGRRFEGIITADLSMERLCALVNAISVLRSGYAFLVSAHGTFVTHPDKSRILHANLVEWSDALNDPAWRPAARDMIRGREGFADVRGLDGRTPSRLYYLPIPRVHWSLGVVVPRRELTADLRRLYRRAALIGLAGLGALTALALGMTRRLTRPLRRMTDLADHVAGGDLQAAMARLPGFEQEIGGGAVREYRGLSDAFSGMVRSLHALIRRVRESVVQVSHIAAEIAASARQLETFASEQAASIAGVNTTAGAIAGRSEQLAATLRDLAAGARRSAGLAEEGQDGLRTMENGMARLVAATSSISSRLAAINRKAENIGGITVAINKVAEQTHLIALNAGVEAEKAGEAGRGFAVVAREIRRLADQTAAATRDIEATIREMHSAVSAGVMEMDTFMDDVRRSGADVQHIGGHLALIIEQARALPPRMEEATEDMGRQHRDARHISDTVRQLSGAADQIKASLEEFNHVTRHLHEAAQSLSLEVARFRMEAEPPAPGAPAG